MHSLINLTIPYLNPSPLLKKSFWVGDNGNERGANIACGLLVTPAIKEFRKFESIEGFR